MCVARGLATKAADNVVLSLTILLNYFINMTALRNMTYCTLLGGVYCSGGVYCLAYGRLRHHDTMLHGLRYHAAINIIVGVYIYIYIHTHTYTYIHT